jgi:ubiquinone/menaquinone biosynthesis C-methylase UbiE
MSERTQTTSRGVSGRLLHGVTLLPVYLIALLLRLVVLLLINMSRPALLRALPRATWPSVGVTLPAYPSRSAITASTTSSSLSLHQRAAAPFSLSASTAPASPSSAPPDPYNRPSDPYAPSSPSASPSSSSSSSSGTADFGFQSVPAGSKQRLVSEVFHRVAASYDLMNDVMSAGVHRLWKHRLLQVMRPTLHTALLDVAGGTGDIAFRFIEHVRSIPVSGFTAAVQGEAALTASVVVCDINPSMLAVGRERAVQYGYLPADAAAAGAPSASSSPSSPSLPPVGLSFVEGNAEKLPFASSSFDCYSIAFGLRNVTNPRQALAEAVRVLKPGGAFYCLEFSSVSNALLRAAYDAYSLQVIPVLGEVVAGDRDSYQYLVESIRRWPQQEELKVMMQEAGLSGVRYENLSLGIAAIHSGWKL